MKNVAKGCYSVYRQGHRPSQVMILFYLLAGGLFCLAAATCPVEAATYYCDPVHGNTATGNGSAGNPWGTLESVIAAGKFITPIVAGDTVKLNAGFHGFPYFCGDYYKTQLNYASDVTVEPNGTAVVECNQVTFKNCKHIRVKGLRISPSLGTPSLVKCHYPDPYPDAYTIVYCVDSNHLTIEDCNIFTVLDTSQWDPNKWEYWAWTGIRKVEGLYSSTIRGNTIKNVWKGMETSSNCLIEDNLIDGFTGDALKIAGPNSVIQDNTILNHYYNPSGSHVDLMQNNAGNNGDKIIIRRNLLVACTDPNRSEGSVGGVQGIYFEPDANDCLIENNVVMALNQSWGISIGKGINTRIVNNTVLRPYGKGYWPDINTGASGNVNLIIRNNIADNFSSGAGITADHNFDISNYNPDVEFVDYAHGNVRLRAGSHFVDAGSSADAPAEDLERNSRPRGQGYDVGAYEYGTTDSNNHAPILQGIGNKSVNENALLTFTVSATDADGDTITYSDQNLPTGATFSSQTFNWTPTYAQTGTYQVTFTAGDGQAQDSETITITVGNVNRPPVLAAIGNKSVSENNALSFSVSATDPDGDAVEFSVNGLPSGATFAGQNFNWQPDSTQVGSHQVSFAASDGTLQDSETITINVLGTDTLPPVVANCSPAADSIQIPLNSLIVLHITDAGKGVDANSVIIKVNSDVIYSGSTLNYSSTHGNCRRSGAKADYTYVYQSNEMFDFDQPVTVTVDAADLAGKAMSQHSYSFRTEMRSFGQNKKVGSGSDTLSKSAPATVRDSAGNIWAVWHAGSAGSRDIYVGKLAAGVDNFGSSVRLTQNTADQCNPAIAVGSDGKLYVVWQDNRSGTWDIYVSTSSGGATWSTEQRVTDINDNQINPAIAVDTSNRAYIVWQDDRNKNQDIYIAASSDGFANETVSQITSNSADQTEPAIAVDSSNTVYVVWTDARGGSSDIYGAASNNGPWTNMPIVSNAGSQSSPAIAAGPEGSILHLLWVDDRSGNQDIYYATSNGLPSSPLSDSSIISIIDDASRANQLAPVIITNSSSKVFACWQDRRNITANGGDTDLYFAELTSNSRTNVLVGDDGTNSDQSEPAIGIGEYGHPYLVWTDGRSANTEIYYAASTFVEPVSLKAKDVSASSGATIGTDPAIISGVDDVSVVVPPGACLYDIKITISKIKNPEAFTTQCLGSYDFGPSGMQFSQPVTVTIPYAVSASSTSASAYWYNSLTGALSQQGITDVENLQISSTLYALRFTTTHFTPFYLLLAGAAAADSSSSSSGGGGGGGGCSMSASGEADIVEFLLPYLGLTIVMVILKLRDRRNRKTRGITESKR